MPERMIRVRRGNPDGTFTDSYIPASLVQSPSASYYYDPAEEARRQAQYQAAFNSNIIRAQAEDRARSQRRSRPQRSERPTAGSQQIANAPASRGLETSPNGGMVVAPASVASVSGYTPDQYADSSGMAYPAEPLDLSHAPSYDAGGYADSTGMGAYVAPVSPEQALSASEALMTPRYMSGSTPKSFSDGAPLYAEMPVVRGSGPGATLDTSPAYVGMMSPDFLDAMDYVQNNRSAPAPVVSPEQALSASEALMTPRYVGSTSPAPVVSPEQALSASEALMTPRYTGATTAIGDTVSEMYNGGDIYSIGAVAGRDTLPASEALMTPRYTGATTAIANAAGSAADAVGGVAGSAAGWVRDAAGNLYDQAGNLVMDAYGRLSDRASLMWKNFLGGAPIGYLDTPSSGAPATPPRMVPLKDTGAMFTREGAIRGGINPGTNAVSRWVLSTMPSENDMVPVDSTGQRIPTEGQQFINTLIGRFADALGISY